MARIPSDNTPKINTETAVEPEAVSHEKVPPQYHAQIVKTPPASGSGGEVPISEFTNPVAQDILTKLDDSPGGNRNKLTSAKEIDTALKTPGGKIITSVQLYQAEQITKGVNVGRDAARAQDIINRVKTAKSGSDPVTADDIRAWGTKLALKPGEEVDGTVYLTSQQMNAIKSLVARITGEKASAIAAEDTTSGTKVELYYPAMQINYNPTTNVPNVASTAYYYEDTLYRTKVPRKNDPFFHDPALAEQKQGVDPAIYSGTYKFQSIWDTIQEGTFDRGHMVAFEDVVDSNLEKWNTMTMANMHPQTKKSNEQVWVRGVEEAIRDKATKDMSRMSLAVGPLFADQDMNPLPKDQINYIAGGGKTGKAAELGDAVKVAVSTFSWKAMLEQTPDGQYSVTCYVVANRQDLDGTVRPQRGENFKEQLKKTGAAILSLTELEGLLQEQGQGGIKLFADLPDDIRSQIADEPGKKLKPTTDFQYLSKLQNVINLGQPVETEAVA